MLNIFLESFIIMEFISRKTYIKVCIFSFNHPKMEIKEPIFVLDIFIMNVKKFMILMRQFIIIKRHQMFMTNLQKIILAFFIGLINLVLNKILHYLLNISMKQSLKRMTYYQCLIWHVFTCIMIHLRTMLNYQLTC